MCGKISMIFLPWPRQTQMAGSDWDMSSEMGRGAEERDMFASPISATPPHNTGICMWVCVSAVRMYAWD